MDAESPQVSWLDYFSGGVPSGEYFRLMLEHLRDIVNNTQGRLSLRVTGLAYVGLVGYFEAFCKDHFASIINIVPSSTRNLAARGQDTTIDAVLLVDAQTSLSHQLGFLLAEKFDFGTAQKINALYNALLLVTPFSKAEALNFDRILRDRHLLVHHGGTYTTSYLKGRSKHVPESEKERPFWDGLQITPDQFRSDASFLEAIGRKTLRSTHAATTRLASESVSSLDPERQKALEAFLWWGSEDG
jgi:hypothetical protein